MILNGTIILSENHLESIISSFSEETKIHLRLCYHAEIEEIFKKVTDRITYFQAIAPTLLTELYTINTLTGITTAQSDQMFDEYSDVLTRIREGAFPTAYYRLCQKTPSGFVTQALIDSWKSKILVYIMS